MSLCSIVQMRNANLTNDCRTPIDSASEDACVPDSTSPIIQSTSIQRSSFGHSTLLKSKERKSTLWDSRTLSIHILSRTTRISNRELTIFGVSSMQIKTYIRCRVLSRSSCSLVLDARWNTTTVRASSLTDHLCVGVSDGSGSRGRASSDRSALKPRSASQSRVFASVEPSTNF